MSVASIPGTSDTLVSLLTRQLEARVGLARDGYEVKLFRSEDHTGPPTNKVSLLFNRVDVDEARRSGDTPAVSPTRPGARWLGLELSCLLTVWGKKSASGEQRMRQHCVEILQEFAIVRGSSLSPAFAWEPEDALRVSLAPMNQEDRMRLWDGFDLSVQLSVPCVVCKGPGAAPESLANQLERRRIDGKGMPVVSEHDFRSGTPCRRVRHHRGSTPFTGWKGARSLGGRMGQPRHVSPHRTLLDRALSSAKPCFSLPANSASSPRLPAPLLCCEVHVQAASRCMLQVIRGQQAACRSTALTTRQFLGTGCSWIWPKVTVAVGSAANILVGLSRVSCVNRSGFTLWNCPGAHHGSILKSANAIRLAANYLLGPVS